MVDDAIKYQYRSDQLAKALEPRSKHAVAILFVLIIDIGMELMQTNSLVGLSSVIASGIFCGLAFFFLVTGFEKEEASIAEEMVPRRLIGAIFLGLSAGALAFSKSMDVIVAIQFTIGCGALSIMTFGLDQLNSIQRAPQSAEQRLHLRLHRIETKLDAAAVAVKDMQDVELAEYFIKYRNSVQKLIEAVYSNPDGHRTVRRHLGPLIDGALDAGRRYQRVAALGHHADARHVILQLLGSLQVEYENVARDYSKGDSAALAREAEVLQDMLLRLRSADLLDRSYHPSLLPFRIWRALGGSLPHFQCKGPDLPPETPLNLM